MAVSFKSIWTTVPSYAGLSAAIEERNMKNRSKICEFQVPRSLPESWKISCTKQSEAIAASRYARLRSSLLVLNRVSPGRKVL